LARVHDLADHSEIRSSLCLSFATRTMR
jgi:hypothetical protein